MYYRNLHTCFAIACLLCFAVVVEGQRCGVPKCVIAGGSCADLGDVCADGLFCNDTYSCAPAIQLGDACIEDSSCINYAIGASLCWNGKCLSVTNTAKEGEACSPLNQCMTSTYCNVTSANGGTVGTCLKYQPKGGNCIDSIDDMCGLDAVCSYGKCIEMYTVRNGANCNYPSSLLASYECEPGLYCNQSNVCVPGFASSNANCTGTACVNPNEYCLCVGTEEICTAPETLTASQVKGILEFTVCATMSNCNLETIIIGMGEGDVASHQDTSCCRKEQCTLYEIVAGKDRNSTCGYANPWAYCFKKSPSHAGKIVLGVGAAVVFALALLIIAYYLRKRARANRYSAIQ